MTDTANAPLTTEDLVQKLATHRRNDVIEPDHRPGGDLTRTRVRCDGRGCDFYGVYLTWFEACEAHETHLAEVMAELIAEQRSAVLCEAAYYYGVIWGSGVTTEENVALVLSRWARHGIGTHPLDIEPSPPPAPPKKFDTYTHTDGRDCLFMTGWSWTAFSGDEQSAMRITCDRTHPPVDGPAR